MDEKPPVEPETSSSQDVNKGSIMAGGVAATDVGKEGSESKVQSSDEDTSDGEPIFIASTELCTGNSSEPVGILEFLRNENVDVLARRSRRKLIELDLPKTACLIETEKGNKMYLLGTYHISRGSCEDVRKMVSAIQPDSIVVELCKLRTDIVLCDSSADPREMVAERGFTQLRRSVQLQKGILSGLVLYALMYKRASVTKLIGLPTGSEFRVAYQESQNAADDMEKAIERDIAMTEILKNKFPQVANVLLTERDVYMAAYLKRILAILIYLPDSTQIPSVVLAVVGLHHLEGIKANFQRDISTEEFEELKKMPSPAPKSKLLRIAVKGSFCVVTVYGIYKLMKWLGIDFKSKLLFPPKMGMLRRHLLNCVIG